MAIIQWAARTSRWTNGFRRRRRRRRSNNNVTKKKKKREAKIITEKRAEGGSFFFCDAQANESNVNIFGTTEGEKWFTVDVIGITKDANRSSVATQLLEYSGPF